MGCFCADRAKKGAVTVDNEQSRQPSQAPDVLTSAGCETPPLSAAAAPELLTFDTTRQADVENMAAVGSVAEAGPELVASQSSRFGQGGHDPITTPPSLKDKSPKVLGRSEQHQPQQSKAYSPSEAGSPMELERLAALFLEGDAIAALKHTSRIALCEALKSPGHYVQKMSQLDPQVRSHFIFISLYQCSSP